MSNTATVIPTVPAGTHVLIKMDHTGDTSTTWTLAAPDTVTLAERAFADLQTMGYVIEAVDPADPSQGTQATTFDPHVARYIAHPALAGG